MHLRLSAVFIVVVIGTACPQNSTTGPLGTSSSSSSGGGTSGGFDAGVIANSCFRDQDCGAGKICAGDGGCTAGVACVPGGAQCGECEAGGTLNCGFTARAYCDTAGTVCRRTLSSCEPCTADENCGENDQLGLPNKCVDYGSGQKYCGLACNGACSPGFTCVAGACQVSAGAGSCQGAVSCYTDTECPAGLHCTTRDANPPRRGVCLDFCLADEECPAGSVCQLQPGPNYGLCITGCTPGTTGASGTICHHWNRFGPTCPGNPCPTGYECSATSNGYCTLPGCQSDTECQVARTICNTVTAECVPGCRTSEDCGAFEDCEGGMCVEQGCRGKDLSCNIGQFCCGKELYDTTAGGQACPSTIMNGACFSAQDPFCRRCEDDNGCMDINSFGVASHCYELQRSDADGGAQPIGKFCSVGCRTNADCPRGFPCRDLPAGQNGEMVKGCIEPFCASLSPP